MQIAVLNKPGKNANGTHGAFLNKHKIRIWNKDNTSKPGFPRFSHDIYGTTIHELAHASHADMDIWNYYNAKFMSVDNKKIHITNETWARGVQWELTRMTYTFISENIGYYYERTYIRRTYTGIVQALIDRQRNKPGTVFSYFTKYYSNSRKLDNEHKLRYSENVEGYTIREIEDALIGVRTLTEWKTNLKVDYANPTENQMDALFLYWKTGY